LAATIKEAFDIEPQLIGGGGGIFDVKANGRMIFSKHDAGRFPEDDEILKLLEPAAK
jgi:selenoprotein W-related protein